MFETTNHSFSVNSLKKNTPVGRPILAASNLLHFLDPAAALESLLNLTVYQCLNLRWPKGMNSRRLRTNSVL